MGAFSFLRDRNSVAAEGTSARRVALAAVLVGFAVLGCNKILGIHQPIDIDASTPATINDAGASDTGANADGPDASQDGGRVCTPDQKRCSSSGVPQKCNTAGTAYEDQAPCPANLPLCDAASGTCTPPCTPQDQRCSPTGPVIQQCDLQGIWRDTPTTCTFVCTGSGASTACGGSCVPSTRRCGANDTPYVCDMTGTDQPQSACPNVCSNGSCAGECKPNTTRCASGSTTMVQVCGPTGMWGAATACTFVCDSTTGNCGGECVPGGPAGCSGNNVQTCDSNGHLTTTMTCTGTKCSGGQCRACVANEKQCNAGKPQTCNASGVWLDDQATACPFVCDASRGVCAGECVPNTDVCTGLVTKHCGANGMYGAGTTCSNICDSTTGRCGGVCSPSTHRCNGTSSETCGADGQWGSAGLPVAGLQHDHRPVQPLHRRVDGRHLRGRQMRPHPEQLQPHRSMSLDVHRHGPDVRRRWHQRRVRLPPRDRRPDVPERHALRQRRQQLRGDRRLR